MDRVRLSACGLWILCVLSIVVAAGGQNPTGTIAGTVTDATNAVVPNAKITVRNQATGFTRDTLTNETGEYRVPLLPVGTYSVSTEISGFKTQLRTGIRLEILQAVRVDFRLELGAVQEVVAVEAKVPQLEVATSASGQVVRNEQVTNLPLNVRQFMQFVFLTPFAVPATRDLRSFLEPRDTIAPTVGGQRPDSNNYQIDGLDDREGGINSVAVSPPIDSIDEFKVQSGVASAEFGRTQGTVINLVTKSGTNQIRGTIYEFLRNDLFDARPFFGTSKSPLRRNQFGGALGGPIIKNKLLLFGNYEGFRQRSGGVPVIGRVPTQEERSSIFSTRIVDPLACTNPRDKTTCQEFPRVGSDWVIPPQRISPISAKILDLWPLPNVTGDPARNFRFQPPSAATGKDNLTLRGDYIPRATDNLYVRYVANDETVETPPRFPNRIGGRTFTLKAWTLGGHYNHVFSPRLVNDLGAGYMKYSNLNKPLLANGENIHARVGITNVVAYTDPLFTGSPNIGIPGYLGPGEATPNFRDGYNTQVTDNLSWHRGKHAFKFGGDFRSTHMDNLFTGGNGGWTFANSYSLNNFADFLLGLPSSLNKTATAEHYYAGGAYYGAFYFQDDWRVTLKLTLNFGVRYEVETAFDGPFHDNMLFDHQKGEMVLSSSITGRDKIESFYKNVRPDLKVRFEPRKKAYDADKNNFSPRFGFAYHFHPRMVLRGGFGIFYTGPQLSWINGGEFTPRALRGIWTGDSVRPVIVLPGREIPAGYNPEGAGGPEATVGPGVPLTIFPIYSRDFPYARNHQWMLSWQTQLTSTLMFEAQYLGSRTNHLLGYTNTNVVLEPSPGPIQPRLPFPGLARIQGLVMGMDGWYNALGLKAEKRTSHGLSLLASYAWSKSLDTGSAVESAGLWTDPKNWWASAKGPSAYDAAHRFVVSYQYELPIGRGRAIGRDLSGVLDHLVGGWGIRGITSLQTGFPYDPSMSIARVNICAAACVARADRIADGNLPKDVRTKNGLSRDPNVAFWDYNAFILPPLSAPRIGNGGRGVLRGPGLNNWDLGIFKSFRISERTRLEFRYEMFNTWNHPQFTAPPNSLESQATFGKLTSTEPPRISQFVLKLNF